MRQVEASTLQTLVENKGLIQADGGVAILTARGASEAMKGVVNNSGRIEAKTLANKNGRILLLADMQHGEVNAAGELTAHFVETSAAKVNLDQNLKVDTQGGEWLIDPVDIVIDAAKASAIQTALASGNVTVSTADGAENPWGKNGTGSDPGDIHINADITWNSNTLTLNANRDININAVLTADGTSRLVMNTGGSGAVKVGFAPGEANGFAGRVDFPGRSGTGFLTINGQDYRVINSLADLDDIRSNLSGHYALGADIDASDTKDWNGGAGFAPLGDSSNMFHGVLDGLGHVINGLTINRPGTDYVGLIGRTWYGIARNIGLVNANITGNKYVGGLVGTLDSNDGHIIRSFVSGSINGVSVVGGLVGLMKTAHTISESYATGTVTGQEDYVGGLVGWQVGGTLSRSYATTSVHGREAVGGLVGNLRDSGIIIQSYATGDVSASAEYSTEAGGLVGWQEGSDIVQSYATGNVTTSSLSYYSSYAGGLVGLQTGGNIIQSYATGNVTANAPNAYAGGLVGYQTGSVSIQQSYAGGAVSTTGDNGYAGGLVGGQAGGGSISQSYATGPVSNTSNYQGYVGGLVGMRYDGDISNSYWNTETTGQNDAVGNDQGGTGSVHATGLTTAQMFDTTSFGGFAFGTVWANAGNQTTPYLIGLAGNQVFNKNDLPTGAIDPTNRPNLYTVVQNVEQLQAIQNNLSGLYVLGNNIDASATKHWNCAGSDCAGFAPIGTIGNPFTGTLDGLGHTIEGLYINRAGTDYVGLFGYADGATLRSLGLVAASITGRSYVGGLVGGGEADISQTFVTGKINGYQIVGGLVGEQTGGSISQSYATAAIVGSGSQVGGLVGRQSGGSIDETYAAGLVTGITHVGGLVGEQTGGSISDSYWNTETTGRGNAIGNVGGSGGATGLTTAQMFGRNNFDNWDFIDVWGIVEGQSYPYFLWQYPASGGAPQVLSGVLYEDAAAVNGAAGAALSLQLDNRPFTLTTGANGFFYQLLAPGTLNDSTLLISAENYGSGNDRNALFFGAGLSGADAQSLSLAGDTFTVKLAGSAAGSFGSYSELLHARELADLGGLISALPNLSLETSGSFTFDQTLNLTGNLRLTGDAGSLFTATEDVNVGRFWLGSGRWEQVSNPLPGFTAADFGFDPGHATFLRALGGDGMNDPYQITDVYGLQGMASHSLLDKNFVLANNIDASGTKDWNNGAGFAPIGGSSRGFTGTLNGLGHVIEGLFIDRLSDYVGLFGAAGGTLHNLGLVNVDITGLNYVGGLVGFLDGGNISLSYVAGSVHGANQVGGLAGSTGGNISQSYASGSVDGGSQIGGLAGYQWSGSIDQSYAASTVKSMGSAVGGLVGNQTGGSSISQSYATGEVDGGGDSAGGLVGMQEGGSIDQSYATSKVKSTGGAVGGLVGYQTGGSSISQSYAAGEVSGTAMVGGLVGMQDSGSISQAYAAGEVSGTDIVGGLVGAQESGSISQAYATGKIEAQGNMVGGLVGGQTGGSVSSSFFATTDSNGNTINDGLNAIGYGSGIDASISGGRSWLQLTNLDTFTTEVSNAGGTAWDIDGQGGTGAAWRLYEGFSTPLLRGLLTPLTVIVNDAQVTYNGQHQTGSTGYTIVDPYDPARLLGTAVLTGGGTNAGAYTLGLSGLYSTQQGYDLIVQTGTLTIDKAPLTVIANNDHKTYDGQPYHGGNGVTYSGFVNGEDESVLGGTLVYGGSAQGALTPGSYTITVSGLSSNNYVLTFVDGQLTIEPVMATNERDHRLPQSPMFDDTEAATISEAPAPLQEAQDRGTSAPCLVGGRITGTACATEAK